MPEELLTRIRKICCIVLDVDGTLTDGSITLSDGGFEIRTFHVRDGLGLRLWLDQGFQAGIISGRSSRVVEQRARELDLRPILLGRNDKLAALSEFLQAAKIRAEECCAIGDDLPDLPLLQSVGVGIAVADAAVELRSAADFTTTLPGGRGAVREAVEWLLQHQGRWSDAIRRFSARPGERGA